MENLIVSSSPHITNRQNSTRSIMLDVLIALVPVLAAAIYFFGYHVAINAAVCMASCFGAEMLFHCIKEKKFSKETVKKSSAFDLSPLVTGLILALNIPSKIIFKAWNLNIYETGYSLASDVPAGLLTGHVLFSFDTVIISIIGSIFAIMLVKMLFGGIGRNFANPAASARIFLMLSFGFTAVNIGFDINGAAAGATWLAGNKRTGDPMLFVNYILGNRGSAAVGETCIIAILIGYIYLSVRKVIDFRVPLMVIGSTMVFALLFDGALGGIPGKVTAAKVFNNMWANVLSGGIVFGAVFMATDYSTSPNTFKGQAIFCVGIGFFTMLMRRFTGMPEGASFAILLMNIVTPLIDRYVVPKPFGFVKPTKKKSKNSAKKVSSGGAL